MLACSELAVKWESDVESDWAALLVAMPWALCNPLILCSHYESKAMGDKISSSL